MNPRGNCIDRHKLKSKLLAQSLEGLEQNQDKYNRKCEGSNWNSKSIIMQNKPWFTNDIKILSKQKKESFIHYKNTRLTETYDEYRLFRSMINGGIKDKKEYCRNF